MLLWFSADPDGVICNPSGFVLRFQTLEDLHSYCHRHAIAVIENNIDSYNYNLDAIEQWLAAPQPSTVECQLFLNAWNLFSDIAVSVHTVFDTDYIQSNAVYGKLFYGNNLPSITPTGEVYIPTWSDDEIRILYHVFTEGLAIFDTYVHPYEAVTA
jgi:hypothetical protein